MKKHYIGFLSTLFLIAACSSGISTVAVEPTASTPPISESTVLKIIEPTTETQKEIVLLDFAISPDGKTLAVYLNTGIYLYNVETSEKTTFYEFESDKYYSELNSWGVIYPPFGAPGALAFNPDGSEIAISDKFQDEYISIWNLRTHEIVDYIANYPNGNFVREIEYDTKGNRVVIRSTYPKSKLQCPEQGSPPEDTLSLISLQPRNNLFEKTGCNRYSVIEFGFSEDETVYFFHFTDSPLYLMYEVDAQTGNVVKSKENDTRIHGRIYDVSPNGKVFAAIYTSNLPEELQTALIDTTTGKNLLLLNGKIDFLNNENRFLVNTSEIRSQSQLQLQEGNKTICVFDGVEYYRSYSKISRDNNTIALLTFDNGIFENSIQIWNIPNCKLLNTIPF